MSKMKIRSACLILLLVSAMLLLSACGSKDAGSGDRVRIKTVRADEENDENTENTGADNTVAPEPENIREEPAESTRSSEEEGNKDTVSGLTPDEQEAEDKSDDENAGLISIDVSWDESTVTFYGDPMEYDFGADETCAPNLIISGSSIDRTEEGPSGDMTMYDAAGNIIAVQKNDSAGNAHLEKIVIYDPDAALDIFVEPSAPTNTCPIDTVVARITDREGRVTQYTADERMMRGGTGIWYFQVYGGE